MNASKRRFFAATLLGAAAVLSTGAAQAWSWNWGSGERVTGEGEVASERREVNGYDAVALESGFKVQIRQGAGHKLELRAERNLLPYIETRVIEGSKGRTLEIQTRRGFNLSTKQTPVIEIEMPALRAVSIAGSGTIKVDPISAADLKASISGSGDIHLNGVKSERLSMSISGSGDIIASGTTATLSVSVAGSGDVKARELQADEAKVSIAGSGDVIVAANKLLKVSIAGSGDVGYVGNPELSFSSAGSGKVRKLTN